jgi:WXG100 family type VII secretion target
MNFPRRPVRIPSRDNDDIAFDEEAGMASGIRVTPEQLQQVAAQLTAGAGNIDAILAQLASAVAPLGSDWAGAAQARFLALWEQWQHDARGLNEALTGTAQLMGQAAASYAQTEQGIAASFGAR